jgi:hypothetical protein
MYKALKLLTHKPKPEKKRKREVILGRSLKSSKQKRKKAQKRKAIKSQRLRREVEARAVSLMYFARANEQTFSKTGRPLSLVHDYGGAEPGAP